MLQYEHKFELKNGIKAFVDLRLRRVSSTDVQVELLALNMNNKAIMLKEGQNDKKYKNLLLSNTKGRHTDMGNTNSTVLSKSSVHLEPEIGNPKDPGVPLDVRNKNLLRSSSFISSDCY